jgi:hypothetical protein
MKQKDLILIVVVIALSSAFSFFISSKLFGSPKNRNVQVEVVEPITANFIEPSKKFFNDTSLNPTQNIQLGDGGNQTPFNESQQ